MAETKNANNKQQDATTNAVIIQNNQSNEEKAKTTMTKMVSSMYELVSDKEKLGSVLKKEGTGAFNANYIALYVAAQKLNDPKVQEMLDNINKKIVEAAAELGYTTSTYSTEKLSSMSYKELQVALKAEFGYIPDVFKNVDDETINYIFSLKAALRKSPGDVKLIEEQTEVVKTEEENKASIIKEKEKKEEKNKRSGLLNTAIVTTLLGGVIVVASIAMFAFGGPVLVLSATVLGTIGVAGLVGGGITYAVGKAVSAIEKSANAYHQKLEHKKKSPKDLEETEEEKERRIKLKMSASEKAVLSFSTVFGFGLAALGAVAAFPPLIAIGIVDAVASIGGALAIHNANRNAAKDLAEEEKKNNK